MARILGSTGIVYAVLFMEVSLFCLLAGSVSADNAVISNTISVTSSSGNNTSDGSVVTGEQHSTVHIGSDVNGEPLQVIDKESTGTPIVVDRMIESGNGTTSITVHTGSASALKPSGIKSETHEEPPMPGIFASDTEASTTGAEAASSSHSTVAIFTAISRFISYVFSFFSF